jgi:hypothetical protein
MVEEGLQLWSAMELQGQSREEKSKTNIVSMQQDWYNFSPVDKGSADLFSPLKSRESLRSTEARNQYPKNEVTLMYSHSDLWLRDCYTMMGGATSRIASAYESGRIASAYEMQEFNDDLLFELLDSSEAEMRYDKRVQRLARAVTTSESIFF